MINELDTHAQIEWLQALLKFSTNTRDAERLMAEIEDLHMAEIEDLQEQLSDDDGEA